MQGQAAENKRGIPRVLVAVPAYGEEKPIGAIGARVRRRFPCNVGVVNDGSPDGV